MKKTATLVIALVIMITCANAQTKNTVQLKKTTEKSVISTPDTTIETVKFINFQGQRKMSDNKIYIARVTENQINNLITVQIVAEDVKCCDNARTIKTFSLPNGAYDFKIFVDEDLKNMQLTYKLYEDTKAPILLAAL